MSDQFIGEIRWFTYVRGAPEGWQLCDGSLLPIAEYDTLYTLLGTTYGGDGSTTFGVPDLRGRQPLHQGSGKNLTPRPLASMGGSEAVALTANQLGGHTHVIEASVNPASSSNPGANTLAAALDGDAIYLSGTTGASSTSLACVGSMGSGNPHENCAPTLPLYACIATQGVFPSQN